MSTIFSPVAQAQCFGEPLDYADAEAIPDEEFPGPFYAVLCTDPPDPDPCLRPPSPAVLPITPDNAPGQLSQEYLLEAVRGDDNGNGTQDEFTSVVWQAEVFDPSVPTWREAWRLESVDSVLAAEPAGNGWKVKFGATGLQAGRKYRFKVAYCLVVDDEKGCTCWSDPTATLTIPTGFPTVGPDAPAGTTQIIEDDFHRAYTTRPKYDGTSAVGGDGLGPGHVWEDAFTSGSSGGNGSYVELTGGRGRAVMPQGAVANYRAAGADHPHSWAEILFEVLPSEFSGYNMDLRGRMHALATGTRMYVVKLHRLHWNPDPDGNPKLTILRSDLTTGGAGTTELASITFEADTDCDASDQNQNCSCWPPIEGADAEPVWFRIEVDDDGLLEAPSITATVAWGNTVTPCSGEIGECPFRCVLHHTDNTNLGHELFDVAGSWGLDAHEGTYAIELFRAGNE